MFRFLWIPLILLPLVEIVVFFAVADAIGVFLALALCVAAAVIGGGLISRYSMESFLRAQDNMRDGRSPFTEMTQGLFVIMAGLLFIFPGFATDALAIVLLALSPGEARWREWFIPASAGRRAQDARRRAERDGIIEGEFSRVDPDPAGHLRGDSGRANPHS